MLNKVLLTLFLTFLLLPNSAYTQVLGPCGTDEAQTPSAALSNAPVQATQSPVKISRIPLPGERAPNFELSAILGDGTVKKIKLSDYDGKWRVVCFYPADFTFV